MTPGALTAQRLGPAVILQGPALAEVLNLVILGGRYRRNVDGVDLSPAHRSLVALMTSAVNDAPMSPTRRRHVAPEAEPAEWAMHGEPMGSAEAAQLLGLSIRQVQRLAAVLGGHRIAGRLVFDRPAVVAYLEQRREQTEGAA